MFIYKHAKKDSLSEFGRHTLVMSLNLCLSEGFPFYQISFTKKYILHEQNPYLNFDKFSKYPFYLIKTSENYEDIDIIMLQKP